MSHVHIPDGVLPVWLWIIGYIIITMYFIFFSAYSRQHNKVKKIALVGVMAALMLVTMSVEIIPPFYHLNLAVLTGIVLGPVLSVLAIFIVNLILAFLGHGGITVVGLNTVLVSLEAVLGYFGFKFLKSRLKNVFASVLIASFAALFISSWATIGTVYIGTQDLDSVLHHDHNHGTIETNHEHEAESPSTANTEHHHEFDIKRFILLILSFGAAGWIIESVITAFIANYINRIKPDVLEEKNVQPGNI